MWLLVSSRAAGTLEEPASDYGGMLDQMDAVELLALMENVKKRLETMGVKAPPMPRQPEVDGVPASTITTDLDPVHLYIDKQFTIRMGTDKGPVLNLRPLVKTLFILFLRHPEGILLKQRAAYRKEMEEIYSVITPNTDREYVRTRVGRLVDLQDNSFSEKASVLNARLDALLPEGRAGDYKIHGYNGQPRRISVSPLLVHWEK